MVLSLPGLCCNEIGGLTATKSYTELIAESVAFHLTGQKLPKNVAALVERSLSYARKAAANGASGDDSADE